METITIFVAFLSFKIPLLSADKLRLSFKESVYSATSVDYIVVILFVVSCFSNQFSLHLEETVELRRKKLKVKVD